MKFLSEIFTDLSYEELSNLSLAADGGGAIKEDQQPKIINYVNDGLLRLHSRFLLKQQDVLLQMYPHITNYHLSPKYAVSQQEPEAEGYYYIRDLIGEPFQGDVIKILEVRSSEGWKYHLNDLNNVNSLFTPQADVLQVPEPVCGMQLSVIYQAKHKKLVMADVGDPEDALNLTPIELPDVLYGALKAWIAYKVFSHMNTQEATAKAQEHLAMYEGVCADAIEHDLVNSSVASTNTKFEQRGFV